VGRTLAVAAVALGWSAACAWVGALLERRRSPAHLVARERRQLLDRIRDASRHGRHGEVELLERQLDRLPR
jgi:hypothetical protein